MSKDYKYYKAINWNAIEDQIDKATWEKLTEQFWLDTRIPLSNDLDDWRKLSSEEKDLIGKVFGGLTLLDTMQSQDGIKELLSDARTQQEEAVLNNISFMEAVHAKSYSSIFSTLLSPKEIEEVFDWTNNEETLQKKAEIINEIYQNGSPLQKKAASVLLESFLFYSGFYTPLYYLGNNKLPNVAEIIKLILRDECLTNNHELLTPLGWKNVSEIKKEDKVAQFNKETNTIEFVYPKNISSHYEKEIYHFLSPKKHYSLYTSPKHRMLFQTNAGVYRETLSKDVTPNQNRFILNAAEINNNKDLKLTDEERFFIAFHTDGSYCKRKNLAGEFTRNGEKTSTVRASIGFKKERKIRRFNELINRLGWKYTISLSENKGTTFYVQIPKDLVDKDRIKRIPTKPFDEISLEWAKDYIEELVNWDGWVTPNENHRYGYGTTDEQAAKYVHTLAMLCGYRTHFKKVIDDRKESFKDYYKIQINKKHSKSITKNLEIKKMNGQQVYGIEVPSTYLVTKADDAISITGNSVHGTYIGYKFQLAFNELSDKEQEELKDWVYNLCFELYENEIKYTELLYQKVGWVDEVSTFLRYNANKALMNLGFDPLFPDTANDVNPIVMNGISTGTSNHDFFSQVGNGYLLGQVESMNDSDYDF